MRRAQSAKFDPLAWPSDFPDIDNANWLKNIYLRRDGAGLKSWTVPSRSEGLPSIGLGPAFRYGRS